MGNVLPLNDPGDGLQGCSDETIAWGVDGEFVEPARHQAPIHQLMAFGGQDVDPATLASRIRIVDTVPERAGLAVTIEAGTRRITVAAKQDLRLDIARDYRRPRYTFEKGRITYGPLTTDGDFLFASQDGGALSYTAVNMTRAQFGDQVLFQSGQSFHGLQFDGTSDPGGIDKVRYWRDTVQVPIRER